MKKGRAGWLAVAVALLAGLALLVPGSPVYVLKFFQGQAQYEGRSARAWQKDLASPDAPIRMRAAFCLGAIGSSAGEAVPDLAHALTDDPDPRVRKEAALALMKMAPASAAAVPALAQALGDPEPFVRMNATIALMPLHGQSRPAAAALIRAVGDESNETNLGAFTFTIRGMAARALSRATAGTAEGVPALTALLKDARSDRTRLDVVRALGELGPEAGAAAPDLRLLLKDKNHEIHDAADEALKAIAREAPAEKKDQAATRPAADALHDVSGKNQAATAKP